MTGGVAVAVRHLATMLRYCLAGVAYEAGLSGVLANAAGTYRDQAIE